MPIRPENRARYPKNWKAISLEVREASLSHDLGQTVFRKNHSVSGAWS